MGVGKFVREGNSEETYNALTKLPNITAPSVGRRGRASSCNILEIL